MHMDNPIPVYCFAAFSGTGKTTFLEKLIISLRERGLSVGVIKHDAHDFEIDREGKDTRRFSQAGAAVVAIASSAKAAFIEHRELSLGEMLSRVSGVDIILVEGYKYTRRLKLAIYREGAGKPFPGDPEDFIAVISDVPVDTTRPVFDIDDPGGVADFLISDMRVRYK